MKLIRLSKDYKEQLRKVYSLVFEDDFREDYCEFCLNHEDFWDQTYGWVDGEKLVSTYTCLDIEVQIRTETFKANYIDGVATLPHYRNQGLVNKMFLNNIDYCRENHIHVIFLDPFKHSYYRRSGFEVAMESNKIEMDFNFLSRDFQCPNYKIQMDYLNDNPPLQKDYKEINEWLWVNSSYSEMRQPVCYEETKYQHKDVVVAIVYDEDNQPQGYIIYTEQDETLTIKDFRYKNLYGFYALKKHILSYKDQVGALIFTKVPSDFPVSLLVDDYWKNSKNVKITKNLSRMMRIVNAEAVLSDVINTYPERQICIEIYDDLISENQGKYIITPEGIVNKLKINDKIEADAKISIIDLVPLVTGRKSATELYFEGKLRLPNNENIYNSIKHIPDIIEEIDKLLPKSIAYNAEIMMSI